MKEPTIDPERLAALLDGRLDARARADVLARLAVSEAEREAFADAAAVLAELEAEGVVPARPPLPSEPAESEEQSPEGATPPAAPDAPHSGPVAAGSAALPAAGPAAADNLARARAQRVPERRRLVPWLAAAAVVAGVAIGTSVFRRDAPGNPGDPGDPGRYAAMVAAPELGLPVGWDTRPWRTTRGPGDPLTPTARGVRLGARLIDLELAARARDTAVGTAAADIAALLGDQTGAGGLAETYTTLARQAAAGTYVPDSILATARRDVPAYAHREAVEIGAWLEAARIAAARRDSAFFRTTPADAQLDQGLALRDVRPDAADAAAGVRAALPGAPGADWDALAAALRALLGALGS